MVSSIEISFKSYEDKLIKNSCQQILKFVPKYWSINSAYLPNKIKKITVLRSPHIDKKSREQFQMKFLKRKITLFPNPTSLMNLSEALNISNASTTSKGSVNEPIHTDMSSSTQSVEFCLDMNEIYLFLENMKQCPFSGVQIQIQIIYKCYI